MSASRWEECGFILWCYYRVPHCMRNMLEVRLAKQMCNWSSSHRASLHRKQRIAL